jgi:hypothetical protein
MLIGGRDMMEFRIRAKNMLRGFENGARNRRYVCRQPVESRARGKHSDGPQTLVRTYS